MFSQIESELRDEPSLLSKAERTPLKPLPSGSILVGAGDSYCAALCASYLSRSESIVLDPYEMITNPKLARSKAVIVISVSGRTKANVAAARSVKGIASQIVGVTANAASPLAKEVDKTILLPYEYQPRVPGMASFALSLAYSARLLSVKLSLGFDRVRSEGSRVSRQLKFSNSGSTFFLGNRALFAVSMYAAAKLYEFFGAKAQYQRLEEFSHMELFSLDANDAINIYDGFDPSRISGALYRSLKKAGYATGLAPVGQNGVKSVFLAVFATQFAVLRWVKHSKIKRPYILDAGKKLVTSDSMIY